MPDVVGVNGGDQLCLCLRDRQVAGRRDPKLVSTQHAYARIALRDVVHNVGGVVGRAVIDNDDVERVMGLLQH
jgi:hypothetical protein